MMKRNNGTGDTRSKGAWIHSLVCTMALLGAVAALAVPVALLQGPLPPAPCSNGPGASCVGTCDNGNVCHRPSSPGNCTCNWD